MANLERVFRMSFASLYPLYVQKAERKGRTSAEVDEVVAWLTGYDAKGLRAAIAAKVDLRTFFAEAPRMNPKAKLVAGLVCGVRVEEVADPLMRKIRQLDKLVDELARGKKMASILRESPAPISPAPAFRSPPPRRGRPPGPAGRAGR